jgi:hypothetical protein
MYDTLCRIDANKFQLHSTKWANQAGMTRHNHATCQVVLTESVSLFKLPHYATTFPYHHLLATLCRRCRLMDIWKSKHVMALGRNLSKEADVRTSLHNGLVWLLTGAM